jgi:hypothetical protein
MRRVSRCASVLAVIALAGIASSMAHAVPVAPAPVCPSPSLDIDGDGVADSFEPVPESCGSGGCVYRVRRSDPARSVVGRVDACSLRLGNESSHGLRDLIAVWRLGAREAIERRLRFDGRAYRAVSERRCASETCAR